MKLGFDREPVYFYNLKKDMSLQCLIFDEQ